jgi:hypothetical protein
MPVLVFVVIEIYYYYYDYETWRKLINAQISQQDNALF